MIKFLMNFQSIFDEFLMKIHQKSWKSMKFLEFCRIFNSVSAEKWFDLLNILYSTFIKSNHFSLGSRFERGIMDFHRFSWFLMNFHQILLIFSLIFHHFLMIFWWIFEYFSSFFEDFLMHFWIFFHHFLVIFWCIFWNVDIPKLEA